MSKFVQKATAPVRFVSKHRVAIAVGVTAVTCMAINRAALKQHNEFLKEHGLYEQFYTPEES